jgi:stage V sporulation protein B
MAEIIVGRFSKNLVRVFAARGIVLVASILLGILTARVLGPEDKGNLSLLLLIPTFAFAIGKLGLGVSVNYVYGKTKSPYVIFNSIFLSLFLGITATIFAGPFVVLTKDFFFYELDDFLLYGALSLVFANFLYNFVVFNVQALYIIKEYTILIALQPLFNLGILVLQIFVFHFDLFGAIIAQLISMLIAVAAGLYILWRALMGFRFRINPPLLREMLQYGSKAQIGLILKTISARVDLLIIAYFLEPVAVGYFAVATSVVEVMLFLPASLQEILLPWLMRNLNQKREVISSILTRLIFFIVILVSLGLLLVGNWLIVFIFGADYQLSYGLAKYLLPGVVALSIGKIMNISIYARGYPNLVSLATGVSVAVLIISDVVLIPVYGVFGAAIGYSLSNLVGAMILIYVFMKLTKAKLAEILVPQRNDFVYMAEMLKGIYSSFTTRHNRV